MGKLEATLKIFGRMNEVGFKLDVFFYNKWFGVLCKEGKLEKAQKLIQAIWWKEVKRLILRYMMC